VGDGGYAMMAGEMLTAKRLNLKIIFVVLNDSELALIRIKQERKGFEKYGTLLQNEIHQPSNSMFGIPVLTAKNIKQYNEALEEAFNAQSSTIIEIFIAPKEYDELILRGNG
jgi:acetolactate synthase-1/2/3 large subunit